MIQAIAVGTGHCSTLLLDSQEHNRGQVDQWQSIQTSKFNSRLFLVFKYLGKLIAPHSMGTEEIMDRAAHRLNIYSAIRHQR